MSRIPLVEPENAPPEVRALYDKFEADGFQILNVMKMFANNHHFLAGLYASPAAFTFMGSCRPAIASCPICAPLN